MIQVSATRATDWHKQAEGTEIEREHRGNIFCHPRKEKKPHLVSVVVFEVGINIFFCTPFTEA